MYWEHLGCYNRNRKGIWSPIQIWLAAPTALFKTDIEMFSGANLYLFALICVICFVLPGNSGLYASQIIQFSKASVIGNRTEEAAEPALLDQ